MGLVGLEAMLRLFPEQEASPRAFTALTRFLEALDEAPVAEGPPARDPLALSFQLKLLWLAGYLPHLTSCAECGSETDLAGFSPRAGGAVCASCANGAIPLSGAGIAGIEGLLNRPLAEASTVALEGRAASEALGVVTATYEYHGGFRLKTLSAP